MDETGSTTTMRGCLAQDTPADTALAALNGLVGAVSGISDCVATRYSVSYRTVILPISVPGTEAKSRDEGVFTFNTTEETVAMVSVPGLTRSKITSSGCLAGFLIDLSDSDIVAFIDAISSGIWLDPFGISFDGAISAYIREVK